MTKRILIVLSEFGYWGEELVGPLETFDEAGYQVDFATPKGKRPTPLPPSMDPAVHRSAAGQVGHLAGGRRQGQGARRVGSLRQADRHLGLDPRAPVLELADAAARHGGVLHPARRGREGAQGQVRRDPAGRRQRPDRRHRQQRPDPRADPALPEARQADRRGVLRRRRARLCARPRQPREHHLRQARHRPLQGVRLQGRDRLHRRHVQHGPAAVPARVHPARRDRSRRRVHRQRRATPRRSSSTTRSSPAARPRTRTSPARRWSRCSNRV